MIDDEEILWDELVSGERFAVFPSDNGVTIQLHHDFDDSSLDLQTIDDVLHRLRQALEKGRPIHIDLGVNT